VLWHVQRLAVQLPDVHVSHLGDLRWQRVGLVLDAITATAGGLLRVHPVHSSRGCRVQGRRALRRGLPGQLVIHPRPPASPQHRANISAALKGKPKSAEHTANLWVNRQLTPEFAEQMARNGTAGKGRPKSSETRPKMSATQAAGRPVLTESIVREIKQLLADGEIPGAQIARRFGITPGAVSSIKRGRNWAHVTIAEPG
jgi:hypothetical protein